MHRWRADAPRRITMRHARIASFAPLALLFASTAHANRPPGQLQPLCTAATCRRAVSRSPKCPRRRRSPGRSLPRAFPSPTASPEFMAKLALKPNALSIHTLDTSAQQSLAMLEDVIAHGDAHDREVARAARADLLNGMVVRIGRRQRSEGQVRARAPARAVEHRCHEHDCDGPQLSRAAVWAERGRLERQRLDAGRRCPAGTRSAFWWRNTPTVTTPGHWLISLSKRSGSAIARPLTSRMCWPLSVTSGAPSLSRTCAVPPIAANCRMSCARRHRNHFHRHREAAQRRRPAWIRRRCR